jgi:hypothetical protein
MRPAAQQKMQSTIYFTANLVRSEAHEKSESWTVTLPKSASAKLPSRGATPVEGAINSFPFRAALEPDGKGSHRLSVNKTMRYAAGLHANGDADCTGVASKVTVEITRAADEPEMRVPMDLRKALAADPVAHAGWHDITPMARRDWIFSICSAKQPETRARRIEKARDMLSCGKRRLCCFPGVKWMMRDNEKSCGIWLPLPSPKTRISPKSPRPE